LGEKRIEVVESGGSLTMNSAIYKLGVGAPFNHLGSKESRQNTIRRMGLVSPLGGIFSLNKNSEM